MVEARPYLRAAILLAGCLVETGHADLARGIYRRVMRQQPRDQHGREVSARDPGRADR